MSQKLSASELNTNSIALEQKLNGIAFLEFHSLQVLNFSLLTVIEVTIFL